MTRPIKFRVWDKVNKEMFNVRTLEWDVCLNLATPVEHIMQFTGLLDKNGKEIYEGDVLIVHDVQIVYNATAPYRRVDFKKGNDYKTVCSFEPGMWLVNGEVSGHLVTVVSNANRRKDCGVEVIGNIYENPELLPLNDTR